MADKKMKSL